MTSCTWLRLQIESEGTTFKFSQEQCSHSRFTFRIDVQLDWLSFLSNDKKLPIDQKMKISDVLHKKRYKTEIEASETNYLFRIMEVLDSLFFVG